MAISSFNIIKVKAIVKAECSSVPKIMVIAGPNGVGKSTLLYELSQKRGVVFSNDNTRVLYQPPHRAIRRTQVQRRFLMNDTPISFMSDFLSRNEVSGLEGLQVFNPARTPDNVDEAGSTIKYTLGKIENGRKLIYSQIVEKAQKEGLSNIDISTLPDIYKPLKDLTKYLLPHLEFDRIDFSTENNIKCIWKRIDKNEQVELDIDDLSSGEKSIIILFLPLIENEISEFLKAVEKSNNSIQQSSNEVLPNIPDRLLIVDEPELHLHPDLQTKILTYFRTLSSGSNVQFIISTHSTTLLDQALDDELYVFRQATEDSNQNQLKKVANNIEKLEALKQLAGNAYLVTTGRSVVCIEGETSPSTNPADIRLFQLLFPRANAFTFVPTGGKANVIKTVQELREHLPENAFGIKIFGIIDYDQTTTTVNGIYQLPVAMIENLLLHNDCIQQCLIALGSESAPSTEDIDTFLRQAVSELRDEEIEFRVMRRLRPTTIRLRGKNLKEVKECTKSAILEVESLVPDDQKLQDIISEIEVEVDKIIVDNTALKLFRGKIILKKIYQKYIPTSRISYSKFCYELAEITARLGKCDNLLNPLFDQLSL